MCMSSQHWVDGTVSTRSSRAPTGGHLGKSGRAWKLQFVATHQHQECEEYFPELEETQLGHIWGQRQGVQSTRPKQPVSISLDPSIKKKHNIFAHIYELNQEDCLTATIYANQTDDFPYISS